VSAINADAVKFKQILYNFLSNAIKFTPKGGTITVSGRWINEKEAQEPDQDFIEFCVSDNGIGIPQNEYDKVFAEFVQIDSSYSKKHEGTGLGLALTKKLVELHGGKIWFESVLEKGTDFYFTLPFTDTAKTVIEKPQVEKNRDKTKINNNSIIMVVEDDLKSSELIRIHLHSAGYRTITAFNGDEVMANARELQPSAITLDIMLPYKDGWEILKELKDDPDTKDIPVIIISVIADIQIGLDLGASGFINKPVEKDEIIKILRDLNVHP